MLASCFRGGRHAAIWALFIGVISTSGFAAVTVDFRQGANNETSGSVTGLGNTHWINSIVQASNALYFEGMSLPQRVLLKDMPSGTTHTLTFNHQWTKSGVHAFDFLTSWDQAEEAGTVELQAYVLDFTGSMVISANACGPDIHSSVTGMCNALRSGYFLDIDVPGDTYVSKDGSTQARIDAYVARWGTRTIRVWSDKPVTAGSLTLSHSVGAGLDTGDSFINYTLQWTTDGATTQAMIEMAAHIAVGDSNPTLSTLAPGGWEPGLGASAIPGGSYHFALGRVDGVQLGSQDNQLKGSAIKAPPTCDLSGDDFVCPNSTNTYTIASDDPAATFQWTITGEGGTITSTDTTQNTVDVLAGDCGETFRLCVTVTPSDGPANQCCIDVTVGDTEDPVIAALPAPTTINCPATPVFTQATATDTCGNSQVTLTYVDVTTPGSCPGNYSVTRTWTATDACNNSSTASQTINVQDITKPVIAALPDPSTIYCPATPSFAQATATDLCDASVTLTFNDVTTPGDCAGEYTVTRTWTATDDCGNSSTASQVINVVDNTAPVFDALPGPTTIDCPAVPVFTQATATDVCGSAFELTSADVTTPGNCAGNYSVTRTWTARDACGNASTATQTINVQDVTAPEIAPLPGPSTINCPNVPVFTQATASDLCDAEVTLGFTDVTTPGDCAGEYSVTRTWTATDDCGNSTQATQTINVVDTTAPVFDALPGPTTINCPAVPVFTQATATDVCGSAFDLTFDDVITPGSCAGTYSVTRTWTATDDCGNSSTASQTINVQDITPPSIACPPDETLSADANCQAVVPDFRTTTTASDTCSDVTLVQDPAPGTVVGIGPWPITITATDGCGNSASCGLTLTVVDSTAPSVTCPTEVNLTFDSSTADNCDPNPTVVITRDDGLAMDAPFPMNKPVTVTITSTDADGNSNSCSFVVDLRSGPPAS